MGKKRATFLNFSLFPSAPLEEEEVIMRAKTGISVFDAMTTMPVMAKTDDTIIDCAKIMKKYSVGSLLIKDGKQVVGILTENDFVIKVLVKGLNPDDTLAGDVMETNLYTIDPKRDLYDAILEMKNNEIRRLPVEQDGKIVGILTMKDILKIQPQLFDLFVERMDLREEKNKPVSDYKKFEEGVCESCGNWSYKIDDSESMKLCPDCFK